MTHGHFPAGTRFLVVDDDAVFRDVLTRSLRRRGFTVESAEDDDSALRTCKAHRPACVILDLKLAESSGLQLIPRLRAMDNAMRILVLTGYASVATAVEAIKLGAVHYLCKPATTSDILAALGNAEGNPDLDVNDQPLSVDRLEWEHIQRVLAEHQGNISATARALNMHRRTLQRKLLKRPVRS